MLHFVVYHNRDTMQRDASELTGYSVVTTKPVSKAIGGRIWVITGRGQPRRYSLVHTFIAEQAGPLEGQPGVNKVCASTGDPVLESEVPLDDLEWFPDFRRALGNFGLGFQRLTNPRFIAGLEAAARGSRTSGLTYVAADGRSTNRT